MQTISTSASAGSLRPVSFCFVHGFGDNQLRFSSLADRIISKGQSACSIGLPEFVSGEPAKALQNRLVEQIAHSFDDVPTGVQRIIVAHSLGGLLSIAHDKSSQLADRFLLIEPSIRSADLDFFQMLRSLTKGQRIAEFSKLLLSDAGDFPYDYLDHLRNWTEGNFEAYCDLAIELIPNAKLALEVISNRTLVAYGQNSWGVDFDPQSLCVGDVTCHKFERSGHWPFVDEMECFCSLLKEIGDIE